MIKVLIYEDHMARQEALQLLLEYTTDMECAGIYKNCEHVVYDVLDTKPDIVLMDIDMPKVNGIEGFKLFRKCSSGVLNILQTVFEDNEKKI